MWSIFNHLAVKPQSGINSITLNQSPSKCKYFKYSNHLSLEFPNFYQPYCDTYFYDFVFEFNTINYIQNVIYFRKLNDTPNITTKIVNKYFTCFVVGKKYI